MTKKVTGILGNTENQEFYERLEQLGLSENDAKVYIFLLERGTAFGGSKIAHFLSLHRQYVHTSVRRLLTLDLIEEVPSGARARYKALPPQYLTHLAEQKLSVAKKIARELERISSIGAEQDFEVYRGTRQVLDFEEMVVTGLRENETQYVIGGGAEAFITFFGDSYEGLSHIARDHGLRTLYVGAEEEIPWLERARAANEGFEYVIMPNFPKTIVQTVVRFGTVTFYSFGNPPLVYVVKSQTVADNYKAYFDLLWKTARE